MTAHDDSPGPKQPSLIELRDALAERRMSALEAVGEALRQAKAQASLNAFLEVFEESALHQAAAVDDARSKHTQLGPLAGVPVAVKDNLCTSWGKTTCASKLLADYRSPFTATSVQRLIDAGAIVIGKTNLDEFGMGSSTEHSAFGPTRNPHDQTRVPGGSSGGSAAAVAAGIVPLALGSDTGGSIRQPASMCGIVGFKPSYGTVSRWGLVAYASSLDQVGPLTRSVADAALVTQIMAGEDPRDATSLSGPAPDLTSKLDVPVSRLVIGVPSQARSHANDPSVTEALERTIGAFRDLGAEVVDVELPHADHAIAAYYVVAAAEASSNLARFDGVRFGRRAQLAPHEALIDLYERSRSEGLGAEVQRRIMLGTHVLSSGYADAYYLTAQKVRRLIRRDFDNVFETGGPGKRGCHAVLMPTAPGPAFRIGEKTAGPMSLYLEDIYTVGVNLAGLPAINMPAGWARRDGRMLPVGMQLVGQMRGDAELLRVARMLERGH